MAFLQKKKIISVTESLVGHELKGSKIEIPDISEVLSGLDPRNGEILAKFLPELLSHGIGRQTKRRNLFKECNCFKKKKK